MQDLKQEHLKAPKTSEQMIQKLMKGNHEINNDALQRGRFDDALRKDATDYMVEKQRTLKGVGIKKLATNMPFGKIRINPDKL